MYHSLILRKCMQSARGFMRHRETRWILDDRKWTVPADGMIAAVASEGIRHALLAALQSSYANSQAERRGYDVADWHSADIAEHPRGVTLGAKRTSAGCRVYE